MIYIFILEKDLFENRIFFEKDSEEITKFGENPYDRDIKSHFEKSYVVVDKDVGPTSHSVSTNLKEILKLKKSGHSGTLDPKVSGILVCGLNRATKLMEFMLKSDKRYICLLYLHKVCDYKIIQDTIKSFIGTIRQLPPVISNVKRKYRNRKIYDIEILDKTEDNKYILFNVSCERGTYIRKLCTDIGEKIGVNSQMIELRRIKAGPFSENDNMICLDKIRNLYEIFLEEKDEGNKKKFEANLREYIRPYEELTKDFKYVIVKDSCINSICNGWDLKIPGIVKIENDIKKNENVFIFSQKQELIAYGYCLMEFNDAKIKDKGNYIKVKKVFMENEIYPRL